MPFRQFHIPGWRDNYYANLLGWNCNNLICAGINRELFIFNMNHSDEVKSQCYRKFHMQ